MPRTINRLEAVADKRVERIWRRENRSHRRLIGTSD
jgi:hypothetical protein